MAELKEILKILRTENNLSQAALSEELGIGVSTIASWETGNRFPRRPYMEQLADYFNVDIDYLYGRTDVRQKIHFDNDGNMMVHLSDFEFELIRKFRDADTFDRMTVLRTLGLDEKKDASEEQSAI